MEPEASASQDRLVGSVFGSFRLIERVGEGAMGAVYRAEHVDLGREVAVKVLRAELLRDESLAARFRREAQAASRIVSPHVLSPIDFGAGEGGRLYMVMDFLQGETLGARLAREGALPPPEAMRIGLAIARAVAAAHEAGVVHRDLKPDNVMLGSDGGVTVLDFGVAKIVDQRMGKGAGGKPLTEAGAMLGTLTYMSPEALSRRAITPAVDVYALGLILFEMLVGRPPFEEADVMLLVGMHLRVPPQLLREAKPDLVIEDAVEQAIDLALSKDPAERPSAAALVSTLARILEGPDAVVDEAAVAAERDAGDGEGLDGDAPPDPGVGDDLDTQTAASADPGGTLAGETTQQVAMAPTEPVLVGMDFSETQLDAPPVFEAATDPSVLSPPERPHRPTVRTTPPQGMLPVADSRGTTTMRVRRITLGSRGTRPILLGAVIAGGLLVGAVSYAAFAGGGDDAPPPTVLAAPRPPPPEPPPVAPPVPAVPAPAHGWLTVRAEPACTVRLGDRVLGRTPLERHEMRPDAYVLSCEGPGGRRTIRATIRAGEETPIRLAPPSRPTKRIRRPPPRKRGGDIQRSYPG